MRDELTRFTDLPFLTHAAQYHFLATLTAVVLQISHLLAPTLDQPPEFGPSTVPCDRQDMFVRLVALLSFEAARSNDTVRATPTRSGPICWPSETLWSQTDRNVEWRVRDFPPDPRL